MRPDEAGQGQDQGQGLGSSIDSQGQDLGVGSVCKHDSMLDCKGTSTQAVLRSDFFYLSVFC